MFTVINESNKFLYVVLGVGMSMTSDEEHATRMLFLADAQALMFEAARAFGGLWWISIYSAGNPIRDWQLAAVTLNDSPIFVSLSSGISAIVHQEVSWAWYGSAEAYSVAKRVRGDTVHEAARNLAAYRRDWMNRNVYG